MTLTILAFTVAIATAIRSTWSPCSLSMLSTLTPAAERARGHHFAPAALWFIAGSLVGGLLPAAVGALLAVLVGAAGGALPAVLAVAAAAAAVCAASDLRLVGFHLPLIPRQVDETWLTRFRRFIYAGGFGVQIGAGVATYVMTAGVYLTPVLAGATGNPWLAAAICEVFALTRGLSLLLSVRAVDFVATQRIHRFLETRELLSRQLMAAVLVGTIGALLAAAFGLNPAAQGAAFAAAAVTGLIVARAVLTPGACAVPAPAATVGATPVLAGTIRLGGAAAAPRVPELLPDPTFPVPARSSS